MINQDAFSFVAVYYDPGDPDKWRLAGRSHKIDRSSNGTVYITPLKRIPDVSSVFIVRVNWRGDTHGLYLMYPDFLYAGKP